MYHIKTDIRAERSSQLLYEALMKCLEIKPFDQIQISDISRLSTVSRATFYRNFDSLIDILAWKSDSKFKEALTSYIASSPDLTKSGSLIEHVVRFWIRKENLTIIETLVNMGRSDIVFNSFIANAGILLDYYESKGLYKKNSDYEYFISIRAGYLLGILRGWIMSGKKDSPEKVTSIVDKMTHDVSQSNVIF
jgi:AcrR family transcriptional regulator